MIVEGSSMGSLSMSERREGVQLVDEVDMASGHHCVVCC